MPSTWSGVSRKELHPLAFEYEWSIAAATIKVTASTGSRTSATEKITEATKCEEHRYGAHGQGDVCDSPWRRCCSSATWRDNSPGWWGSVARPYSPLSARAVRLTLSRGRGSLGPVASGLLTCESPSPATYSGAQLWWTMWRIILVVINKGRPRCSQ